MYVYQSFYHHPPIWLTCATHLLWEGNSMEYGHTTICKQRNIRFHHTPAIILEVQ